MESEENSHNQIEFHELFVKVSDDDQSEWRLVNKVPRKNGNVATRQT